MGKAGETVGDDDLLEVSGPVSVRAFDLPVEGGRMSARKQGGGAVCQVYITRPLSSNAVSG